MITLRPSASLSIPITNPAALVLLPKAYALLDVILRTYFNKRLFAVLGSPTNNVLMSPRKSPIFSPLTKLSINASFSFCNPHISGANESVSMFNQSPFIISLYFVISSSVGSVSFFSSISDNFSTSNTILLHLDLFFFTDVNVPLRILS